MRASIMPAASLLLAVPLAGCSSGGFSLSQGGMSDATNSFASDHSYNYSCSKFDPVTGAMTDQVTVARNINPNAQAVGAMASAFQSVVGLVGAIAKPPVPAPLGARPGLPPGSVLDVPTCLGEHGVNTPMAGPSNPTPPAQPVAPPRQPAAFDPGWHEGINPDGERTRRLLDHVGDDGSAVYYVPSGREYTVSARAWLAFAGGAAHAADDGRGDP